MYMDNVTIETAGTQEEAVLGMEVEETGKQDEEGDGTLTSLGALSFLTQDADLSGTTLVDARNGFNEMRRLAMLWTVQHRWTEGAKLAFNCYRHWA